MSAKHQRALPRGIVLATVLLALGCLSYLARPHLPPSVRGTLADFLWAAAFACTLATVTARSVVWLTSGLAVAGALEVVQLIPQVPGTFDVADLGAIGTGYALGLVLERVLGNREHASQKGDTAVAVRVPS